jgi:hypothetical protein
MIRAGYALLQLETYFTVGPKEARAWTIPMGTLAPQAAGVIHGDFERGFIRAETISYDDFVTLGGEQGGSKDAGKMRAEGKSYEVKDGDVLHFLRSTPECRQHDHRHDRDKAQRDAGYSQVGGSLRRYAHPDTPLSGASRVSGPAPIPLIWWVQYQRRVVQLIRTSIRSSMTWPYQTTVCGAVGHRAVVVKCMTPASSTRVR